MTKEQILKKEVKLYIIYISCVVAYIILSITLTALFVKNLSEEEMSSYAFQVIIVPPIVALGLMWWIINTYITNLLFKEIYYPYLASKGLNFVYKAKEPNITIDELVYPIMFPKNSNKYKYVVKNMVNYDKEISFRSCDVDYYYMVSTGKSTQKITVFNGRLYVVNDAKHADLWCIIREEGNVLKAKPKELHQIEFESISFNKKFNVYANNELKTFIALKPQTLERIASLESSFDGTLYLAMRDGLIYYGKYHKRELAKFNRNTKLEEFDQLIESEKDVAKQIIAIFE